MSAKDEKKENKHIENKAFKKSCPQNLKRTKKKLNATEAVLIFAACRIWEFPDYPQRVVGFHNVQPPTQLSRRTNRLLILLWKMREKK